MTSEVLGQGELISILHIKALLLQKNVATTPQSGASSRCHVTAASRRLSRLLYARNILHNVTDGTARSSRDYIY